MQLDVSRPDADTDAGLDAGAQEAPTLSERIRLAGASTLLARPWFDDAALYALRNWFFPASRLWAAASVADGDPDRFWDAVPMLPRLDERDRLRRVLARFEQRKAAAQAIEAEWQRVMFGPADAPAAYRRAVEAERRQARHDFGSMRADFRFLIRASVPRVKMAVDTPEQAEAAYGAAAAGDVSHLAGPPDTLPAIEVSRRVRGPFSVDHWVRFNSPSKQLGDQVTARVHEPLGVRNPPSLIFGHGICVEPENWAGLIEEAHALVRLGFRVIRPDAPWHGRRVPAGRFGGERIIAAFPTGALDAFLGSIVEWAVLAAWARQTSTGAVVFAGSSLGAMTSQLAAERARDWPAATQPDALLLITHTADVGEAVISGALSRIWASPEEVKSRGWTEDMARRYFALVSPSRPPVVPPERIVTILGSRDVVLPFESGQRLVDRWGVPEANRFVWDRGHFSVPMTLIRNDAPLRRLAEIAGAKS